MGQKVPIDRPRVRTTDDQEVREFAAVYSLEKSAISEHFIEANRDKLKQMTERCLEKMRLCALLIDAMPFAG